MAEQQTVNLAAEGSSPSSGATTERDEESVIVPRWVAGVLAEELAARTDCDGSIEACPRCEAIRIARDAYEHG
jgi:hypothetical protein